MSKHSVGYSIAEDKRWWHTSFTVKENLYSNCNCYYLEVDEHSKAERKKIGNASDADADFGHNDSDYPCQFEWHILRYYWVECTSSCSNEAKRARLTAFLFSRFFRKCAFVYSATETEFCKVNWFIITYYCETSHQEWTVLCKKYFSPLWRAFQNYSNTSRKLIWPILKMEPCSFNRFGAFSLKRLLLNNIPSRTI